MGLTKHSRRQLPIRLYTAHSLVSASASLLLFCTGYELTIFTTDKRNAGTSNNLQIQLVGSKATSRLFTIRNSSSSKGTRTAGMLQRGGVDVVQVAAPSLGTITSVRVTHVPPKRNQGVSCGSVHWCMGLQTVPPLERFHCILMYVCVVYNCISTYGCA